MACVLEDSDLDHSSDDGLGSLPHRTDAEEDALQVLEKRKYHKLLREAYDPKYKGKLRCPFNYPNEDEDTLCVGNQKYPNFAALRAHAKAEAAKPDDEGRHRILLDMMVAIEDKCKIACHHRSSSAPLPCQPPALAPSSRRAPYCPPMFDCSQPNHPELGSGSVSGPQTGPASVTGSDTESFCTISTGSGAVMSSAGESCTDSPAITVSAPVYGPRTGEVSDPLGGSFH